jgi:hypothetical protein
LVLLFVGILSAFWPHATKSIVEGKPLVARARTTPDAPANSTAQPSKNAVAPISAKATPKELAFPTLKLQGIFFAAHQPSAILDGNLVHPNDRLPSGVRVIYIGPSSVTLEYNNQRKTLTLK